MKLYTTEDKLAHVERAKAYVKEGKGTYSSYAREAGVPRTTVTVNSSPIAYER